MKPKQPKRLGLRRKLGSPIFLSYRIIESGKQIKSYHFPRNKAPLIHT